ncbi:AcrB/AcrD/AcrF family protein [Leucobacter luti]|uniref:AcrB/AcrD/AcrF family protein n=1 Tax=Leucobacter luti TaxID=340320 RepID=A0A4R6RWC7_9MICO|nr:efflux RND transporter permease subunit [Leucobacter luti]TDP91339.1 AcrB/AcrD/AcrF family protein [Leucobacter luti]
MTFLTHTSLKNRLVVGLATLAIAVIGLFSMGALKQELMPSMQVPMAFVGLQSTGLAPEEMASTLTEPVEQAIRAVPGVTSVTSSTSSGNAQSYAEWAFSENDDETMRAIRSAAESLKPSFPSGTELQVMSGGSDDMPAMVLSAGTSKNQESFGDALAQTVGPALQGVSGVRTVDLAGRETQEIIIELRAAAVTKYKVDPSTFGPILQATGATLPAGQATSGEGPLSITVGANLTSIESIAALPITVPDGVILISDFADVRAETIPTESISRVNGAPALTLQIIPAQGANVVQLTDAYDSGSCDLALSHS